MADRELLLQRTSGFRLMGLLDAFFKTRAMAVLGEFVGRSVRGACLQQAPPFVALAHAGVWIWFCSSPAGSSVAADKESKESKSSGGSTHIDRFLGVIADSSRQVRLLSRPFARSTR
jgi:hypothetical protein